MREGRKCGGFVAIKMKARTLRSWEAGEEPAYSDPGSELRVGRGKEEEQVSVD